ncbi:aldo/keto reductase [Corynebacterium aquilae]|uniref:Aldo/keto reductase n=1 Tax=Corynebacterium aquilae DSM 44791 TaxID=1431546 RepID=A0A1L7CG62_9CORY|nr:aldo/keto reductase [Corynebacterium aquilae]APT84763.1 aldo/keto reductase [Corynebacterium aquilae DSM 44791]
MKQRTVGHSGLRVSSQGLGTVTWGDQTGEDVARAQVSLFRDHGGTLIDVAPSYNGGAALHILGRVLSSTDRDDVVLSTASGVDPTQPLGRRVDCSRRNLIASLDATLSTIGTDFVDLWSVEFWDPRTSPEEVADTLDYAVRTGRARYAGVRSYAGWQLAVTHAAANHAAASARPIVAAQSEYNLLVRRAEEELLPATAHLGVGFFAAAGLAQGVLTGKYRHAIPECSRGASPQRLAEVHGYLDDRTDAITHAVATAAQGLGVSAAMVSAAWLRDAPGVTSYIIGARSVEQLKENLESENLVLPVAIREAFDEISRS